MEQLLKQIDNHHEKTKINGIADAVVRIFAENYINEQREFSDKLRQKVVNNGSIGTQINYDNHKGDINL